MNIRPICKKCVLPESRPDIWLNEDGICNICIEYERIKNTDRKFKFLETDFVKTLNRYKGKGEYDCLVMCSGGKDSTSALYYMKKKYKLNPLAFTFDHGFEPEEAMENIRNAVGILGVDFLFFKSDFMRDMFLEVIKSNSRAVICHLCSLWYMDLTFKIAAKFNIQIIIAGWTKGQSTRESLISKYVGSVHQSEFISMAKATKAFVDSYARNDPKYKNFPGSMEEVLLKAKKKHKCIVLSPHWFLPFDSETYTEMIKKDLKWNITRLSYPTNSTNCYLNFVSVYNSMKHFGYTHYHVEMSKLIREGEITREEALKALEINFDDALIKGIIERLNCRSGNRDV